MRLTLIGTGAAGGVPLYGCQCQLCKLAHQSPELRRAPASALIEQDGFTILIDAGLMNLAERFPAGTVDTILLTHFHPDHVQGLFHIRWGTDVTIPVVAPYDSNGCADLLVHPGILRFTHINSFETCTVGPFTITTIPLTHSRPTLGYLIKSDRATVAYLCDTGPLTEETISILKLATPDCVVIDSTELPNQPAKNHNSLTTALSDISAIETKQAVLTHIGHDFSASLLKSTPTLPSHVVIGFDEWTTNW